MRQFWARASGVRVLLVAAATFVIALGSASPIHSAASGSHRSGTSGQSVSRQIAFYSDIGNSVNSPYRKNPLVVRPSGIALFEDGSWFIGHLHWVGWGTSVARATGISSASDGIPDAASGKRTNDPARFTLSHPGRVIGHLVYRCFQLTFPSDPKYGGYRCLKRDGKDFVYSGTALTAPPAKTVALQNFLSPDRKVWCGIWADYGLSCVTGTNPEYGGRLERNGNLTICNGNAPVGWGCTQNGNDRAPVLRYGQTNELGGFRCLSASNGITCTVIAGTGKGKGFLINASGVTKVGP